MEVDPILAQSDPIAVIQRLLLDPRFVDESSMRASKILNEITFAAFYKFGVVPGYVLIIEHNIGIAFPAYQDFRCSQGKDILLSIGSQPVESWR